MGVVLEGFGDCFIIVSIVKVEGPLSRKRENTALTSVNFR